MFKKILLVTALLGTLTRGHTLMADSHHAEHEENEEQERRGGRGAFFATSNLPLVKNAKWKTECASCHMLFPPALLPARSWGKLMGGLDKHFGEDASIDLKSREEITKFLESNSAENSSNRRGGKIDRSIAPGSAPIRITETPYFIHKHDEISISVWKRPKIKSPANCVACHKNAEQGVFSEHEVSIPNESTPR